MFDFPASPSIGQVITGSNGASYQWDGVKWNTSSTVTGTTVNNVGRNLIHNGLFNIAQRGAGPFTGAGVYTSDRWLSIPIGSTASVTVIGLADADRTAIGDEAATYALQYVCNGTAGAGDYVQLVQPLEGTRRTSGKTVTLSFWAKAAAGTPKLGIEFYQNFGSGGSPSAPVTGIGAQAITLSTTWTRYVTTVALPSSVGKTWGNAANTDFWSLRFWLSSGATNNAMGGGIGVQSYTLQLYGVQLELGNVATPLEKLDIQTDLANCQRFFTISNFVISGYSPSASVTFYGSFWMPVAMRAIPSITFSNIQYGTASGLVVGANTTNQMAQFNAVTTGAGVGSVVAIAAMTADL